ncbi:uncharacterized protein [Linepithema humile]|uniref:uncharacterized protein n=1 Tax=Linepithema humile TaxID=83485 RepID=UPI00351E74AF
MSEEIILTKDNVWDYLEQIPKERFKAKCKTCKTNLTYANLSNFSRHLRFCHNDHFASRVKENIKNSPDTYYNEAGYCLICSGAVQQEDYSRHMMLHPTQEVVQYVTGKTKEEYYTQTDVFELKCTLNNCNERITCYIIGNTKNHISKHNEAGKLEKIDTGSIYVPNKITDVQDLWKNYTCDDSNFLVNCKFPECQFQGCYIDINLTKFCKHVEDHHEKVFAYEKQDGNQFPRMYFKYRNEEYSECCLCASYTSISTVIYALYYHLETRHPGTPNFHHTVSWGWKYCQKSNITQVKCNFCSKLIDIDVDLKDLNHHTENTHMKEPPSTEKAHEIAGPSKSQQEKKSKKKGIFIGE